MLGLLQSSVICSIMVNVGVCKTQDMGSIPIIAFRGLLLIVVYAFGTFINNIKHAI